MTAQQLWEGSTVQERSAWLFANKLYFTDPWATWGELSSATQAQVQAARDQQVRRNYAAIGVQH